MPSELPAEMIAQLLQLPYEQRGQLADTLISSLHPEGETLDRNAWQESWLDECRRRREEIEMGAVTSISKEEFVRRLRSKHGE